jgi:hypothetical protein
VWPLDREADDPATVPFQHPNRFRGGRVGGIRRRASTHVTPRPPAGPAIRPNTESCEETYARAESDAAANALAGKRGDLNQRQP